MANGVYNKGKAEVANGGTNLSTATLKVLLVNSTYTFNPDDDFVSTIIAGAKEISVAGYARQTLANKTVTQDNVNDFAYLDGDDSVFTGLASGQTIGGAVLFRDTGVDTTSPALAFYDLTDTATNGGNVTIQWATPANGGVLKLA